MIEYLSILAFVLGGLIWNNIGYISAWRKYKGTPEWKGFEKSKLRDDLLLGLGLGLAAWGYDAYTGNLTALDNSELFIGQIVASFTAVAFIDKLLVGGILKR